jgi:hypothetical protein
VAAFWAAFDWLIWAARFSLLATEVELADGALLLNGPACDVSALDGAIGIDCLTFCIVLELLRVPGVPAPFLFPDSTGWIRWPF